jgi:hypothetical protein
MFGNIDIGNLKCLEISEAWEIEVFMESFLTEDYSFIFADSKGPLAQLV